MKRYETRIEDGILSVESANGWEVIGELSDIHELVGGETYTIEYDDHAQVVSWLDTEEDGTFTFDVRDTLDEMSYNDEFITQIVDIDPDATDEDGYSLRTSVFADLMTEIWDSKGNLE